MDESPRDFYGAVSYRQVGSHETDANYTIKYGFEDGHEVGPVDVTPEELSRLKSAITATLERQNVSMLRPQDGSRPKAQVLRPASTPAEETSGDPELIVEQSLNSLGRSTVIINAEHRDRIRACILEAIEHCYSLEEGTFERASAEIYIIPELEFIVRVVENQTDAMIEVRSFLQETESRFERLRMAMNRWPELQSAIGSVLVEIGKVLLQRP